MFCYTWVLLTQHLLENFHNFFYFKILPVTVFAVVKGKNDRSLQEYNILKWQNRFSLIFKNSNISACWLRQPWKLKRSGFFVQNNNSQKSSFGKLFTRKSFCEKKIRICDCTPSNSFPSSPWNVNWCRCESLPIFSYSFKSNILNVSHSYSAELLSYTLFYNQHFYKQRQGEK